MNNNNPNGAANNNQREFLTLQVSEKDPFKPTYDVETITKTQLLALVDTFFKGIFADFYKSEIAPMQTANGTVAFDVVLNFRPNVGQNNDGNNGGKLYAFVEDVMKERSSNATINKIINNASARNRKATKFMISQEATELLRTLFIDNYTLRDQGFITDPNPRRYCNLNLIAERVVSENRGPMNAYLGTMPVQIIETAILHIDINKVIAMIKGDKGDNGEKYTYSVRFVTDLFANSQNQNGVFSVKTDTVLEIMRANTKEWERFISVINGGVATNQEIYSDYRNIRY